MKTSSKFPRLAVRTAFALAILLPAADSSRAAVIYTFSTPAGATNTGLPVSAQAVISLDSNVVDIALTNTLQTPIQSIGEALTGFKITYSGGQTAHSIISSSGEVILVDSGGIISSVPTDPQTISASGEWQLSGSWLSVFGGGSPNYALLDTERPNYSQANASITGNKPHNPYTDGTINFKLDVPGMTTSTKITSVVFQFGTAQDPVDQITVTNSQNPVPEPVSLALWSAALVTMGYRRLRIGTIKSNEKAMSS